VCHRQYVSGRALAVELTDVTVHTNGRTILGPISLEVGAKEHWALLGPNGAGKTTLLSLAGAHRHPSSGRATVLGGTLGRVDLRDLRRRIGAVGHNVSDLIPFDQSTLEVVLTGKEGLLASWWGEFTDADREAAAALLRRVGLGDLVGQPFGRCSQGERQRVLVARSLFGEKELLLLDEPAVGVDLPGREALIALLDDLARTGGPPTIHVAHTLEELPGSTTHVILLSHGRTVAEGPIDDVLVDAALSACYGIAVVVERHDGRYFGRAVSSW
jgi:iron complex transport system ATP-binding protein